MLSLTTGIIKKVLKVTRNKKNNHNKIVMLAKSKLNSIETLISQELIDLEISHEELKTIVKEKEKYEKMKENIRMIKSSDELGENNGIIRENRGVLFFNMYHSLIKKSKANLRLEIQQMNKSENIKDMDQN